MNFKTVILWSIQIHYFALNLPKIPFECLKARRDLFQAFDDNTRRFWNIAFLILEMGIFLNLFCPRVVKELNLWKQRLSICYYKSLGQRRGLKFVCPLMTSRLPYRRLKQLSSMFPPEIKLLFRKHFLWFWLWNFLTYCANAIWEFPGNEICQVIFGFDFWSMKPRKRKYVCKFGCEPNSASLMNQFMAHWSSKAISTSRDIGRWKS